MKVVHISMQGFLDGWGYQENLLPEYMADAGHSVTVVSSAIHFPSYLKEEERTNIIAKGLKYSLGKVQVRRIKNYIVTTQYSFIVSGLYKVLKEERPDVIFHHDVNSSSMMVSWVYCLFHKNVKFFIDNHADEINQSPRKLWNLLVPKGLMRVCTKLIQRKVVKFYGVTPGRCDYLANIFGASKAKISLLPIGGDTKATDAIFASKLELKEKYRIPKESIVLISGGKMGVDKGTVSLIKAYIDLKEKYNNLVLLLFGQFTDSETEELAKNTKGVYQEGWCDRIKTLELLKLANVACWPIHHTTLIEDALASSIPLVLRKTYNTSHSIKGNGVFVENGNFEELILSIDSILRSYDVYKKEAMRMHDNYSYTNLVKQFENDCIYENSNS